MGAVLACWICKFLLASMEANYIDPSIVKVVNLMATQVKFSLAITIFASIYDGLRKIDVPNLRE